jgi:hypothetical protein
VVLSLPRFAFHEESPGSIVSLDFHSSHSRSMCIDFIFPIA